MKVSGRGMVLGTLVSLPQTPAPRQKKCRTCYAQYAKRCRRAPPSCPAPCVRSPYTGIPAPTTSQACACRTMQPAPSGPTALPAPKVRVWGAHAAWAHSRRPQAQRWALVPALPSPPPSMHVSSLHAGAGGVLGPRTATRAPLIARPYPAVLPGAGQPAHSPPPRPPLKTFRERLRTRWGLPVPHGNPAPLATLPPHLPLPLPLYYPCTTLP
jgi:hypothetical protein